MENEYSIILINKKEVLIDNCDKFIIEDYNWRLSKGKKKHNTYIKGNSKKDKKYVTLHRLILERKLNRKLEKNEFVDHINGNSLDNRRFNLRIVNNSQNLMNSKCRIDSRTGYKGVGFIPDAIKNKYRATIFKNKKNKHLGVFETPEDAAKAYDKAAKELHGEYARLNFPEE